MKPYSLDLRKRVLATCDEGYGTGEVAELFQVSSSWVRRINQRRRETGRIEPLPQNSGRKPKLTPEDLKRLMEWTAQKPDATLKEIDAYLGKEVCLSTIWLALQRLKLTFKKKRFTLQNKTGRTFRNVAGNGRER
jgi:transposase